MRDLLLGARARVQSLEEEREPNSENQPDGEAGHDVAEKMRLDLDGFVRGLNQRRVRPLKGFEALKFLLLLEQRRVER